MQEVDETIWVIALKRNGLFVKSSKVMGEKVTGTKACGQLFFTSAEEAFKYLNGVDKEIAKSFGVFEIPISQVYELQSSKEEGKSSAFWDKIERKLVG